MPAWIGIDAETPLRIGAHDVRAVGDGHVRHAVIGAATTGPAVAVQVDMARYGDLRAGGGRLRARGHDVRQGQQSDDQGAGPHGGFRQGSLRL